MQTLSSVFISLLDCELLPSVVLVVAKSILTFLQSRGIFQAGSGLPFPSPGDFPDSGIEPTFPAWQADSSMLSQLGSLYHQYCSLLAAIGTHNTRYAAGQMDEEMDEG